jgi:hypothetical protein
LDGVFGRAIARPSRNAERGSPQSLIESADLGRRYQVDDDGRASVLSQLPSARRGVEARKTPALGTSAGAAALAVCLAPPLDGRRACAAPLQLRIAASALSHPAELCVRRLPIGLRVCFRGGRGGATILAKISAVSRSNRSMARATTARNRFAV